MRVRIPGLIIYDLLVSPPPLASKFLHTRVPRKEGINFDGTYFTKYFILPKLPVDIGFFVTNNRTYINIKYSFKIQQNSAKSKNLGPNSYMFGWLCILLLWYPGYIHSAVYYCLLPTDYEIVFLRLRAGTVSASIHFVRTLFNSVNCKTIFYTELPQYSIQHLCSRYIFQ